MKFLTDRKEIANEINIKETPVIVMNLRKCIDGYERCYKGDKVLVNGIRCTLAMYGDEINEGIESPMMYKKIILSAGATMLKASFGYSDVVEDVEWRKAMRVNEGDEIIVMFDDGEQCALRKMRVGKVTKWCSTAAVLQDID